MQDFDKVVSDAQNLLGTIGDEGNVQLAEAKNRMQVSLAAAKGRLLELQANVGESARAAANGTDAYVRENPWPMMGACAAVGIAVGYALARHGPSNGHDNGNGNGSA
jgi:ElaB/YqjD/DUF883 family membrane-anchored ribosome-binding protein